MRDSERVGIVGAGPAGARAAELLAREGAEVVLFDAKAPWEKPCGGGLTPALFDEAPELRDALPLARPVQRARIELGPDVGFDVGLEAPIWMISRRALGRWQLERALDAGACHVRARVRSIERVGDGWSLESDAGRTRVSTLLGADGAASTVRAAAAPTLRVGLIATRVTYPCGPGPTPETLVLRFFPDLVGYLWDFPRPDHRSIGVEAAAGSHARAELDGRVDAYGPQAKAGAPRPPCAPRAGAVIGTSRHGHGDFSAIAGRGFALLGDAAGFADPFTGEGIRNAIRSADLFVRAWQSGPDWHVTYPALARTAFAREFAAARVLQTVLSERGLGVHLVRWAVRSSLAYAIVTATLNTASVHDYAPGRLRRLFTQALESRLRPA